MMSILSSPISGVLLTLIAYEIGVLIQKKTKQLIFNPLLIAIAIVIAIITLTPYSHSQYQEGAQLISFFLAPATVVLAVPLFNHLNLLKANLKSIAIGIVIGTLANGSIIIICAKFFNLSDVLKASLLPKSTTTPIGISLSAQLGGIPEITIAAIIITGITGAVLGSFIFKVFKIDDAIARGISLGTASHAIGTVKAFELGETEGAMSSLAIGLTGLVSALLLPLLVMILNF